jgi:hypothetical protein
MNWNRTTLALALAAVSAIAPAQELYAGTSQASAQGLTLRSWGSGTARETDEAAYEGTSSIRVSSRNYFQGGIIAFVKPVSLGDAFQDSANLLRLAVRLPARGAAPGGGPGGRGGRGGAIGEGDEGGGAPSSGGFASGGGAAAGGGAQPPSGELAALSKLRLVLTTSDGKKSEAFLDVSTSFADARGWTTVGIPLAAISGFAATNKSLESIALSCDAVATVYVGEIKIVNDPTPVYGEASPAELNLALGDVQIFRATGSAGSTPARFLWDFDDGDGIQIDAEGATVRRAFRKAGTYTVTLTTVDAYGLKKPHVTTVKVTVNP